MHPLVRAFLLSRQADGISPRSVEWHEESLRKFTKWLSDNGHPMDAEQWTIQLLREYVAYLQGTSLASATVTSKVQSLLAFTRWLHEEEFTPTNIGARLKKPKPLGKQPTPFTNAELKSLLLVSKESHRDHAPVALLIDCGLQANELCSLRVEDVFLDQGLLKVTGKGNKQRVVPYSPFTAKVLAKWMARSPATEFVFPAPGGKPLVVRSLHSLIGISLYALVSSTRILSNSAIRLRCPT